MFFRGKILPLGDRKKELQLLQRILLGKFPQIHHTSREKKVKISIFR